MSKWQSSCFEKGCDTAVQATAPATHLCVKAISQPSTDEHPPLAPSEVFYSQSWISVTETGRAIALKMKVLKYSGRSVTKREWLAGQWPLCSGSEIKPWQPFWHKNRCMVLLSLGQPIGAICTLSNNTEGQTCSIQPGKLNIPTWGI